MRTFASILIAVGVMILGCDLYNTVYGKYVYEKSISSYWNLAEKASSIPKKAEYIDKYVQAIKDAKMEGKYNAIIFPTPDNAFDTNFDALVSLQTRLHEIRTMDVSSFQYQTAIQQITAQEQGEAQKMLRVFDGIWWKEYHPMLWDWVALINILGCLILIVAGAIILIATSDNF